MASKRIAGITIEIGGDTSNLQKALKGVDTQLSKTQSNLKDVEKLLKLDPGNTELLTQKQKNLNKAIDTTKKRLEKLKTTQTDSLSTDEYDALQREIIETEQNLEELQKEYKKFGSVSAQQLQNIGSKVKNAGSKITGVGKSLTKYVSAPLVGIGTAAYAAFTEVDEGMDTIIKKTGASGKTLEEFGDIMKDIAETIPTDFKTAGEAVGEVNTRFGVTGETLRGLSEQYIKFAEINGTDVTGSIDATQKALAAFNLGADEAGQYLDFLTAESQRTGIDVMTLAGNIVSNSTAFQEMGLSIYDATKLMSDLEVSGADTNVVMAGLRKALKNAAAEGKPLDEALADLQESILNGTEGTDGLTKAYELFGNAGAQVYEAVKNGTIDFNDLAGAAEATGGTVSETFEATLDPADRFKVAMNNIKTLGADLAEEIMPLLEDAIGKVRDVVQKAKEKWDGLTDAQKETIKKVLGVAIAIGPLLLGLGNVVTKVGSIIDVIGNVKAAIDGAGGLISLLTGPAGISVAIGGVIVAGIWMVKHWDEVKAKAKEIWEKIKKFFSDAYEKIKNIDWKGLGKTLWDGITSMFSSVGTWFRNRFNDAKYLVSQIDWAGLGNSLWNLVKTPFISIKDWFKERFNEAWGAIATINWGSIGSGIWAAIKSKFGDVKQWFYDKFKTAVNGVVGLLNAMIGKAEGAINKVVDGINSKLAIHIPGLTVLGKTFAKVDWEPNIRRVSFNRIKYLAMGGVLGEGQHAVVGEHAPEYLRVVNGQAVVTPIQGAGRFGGTTNNTINIYTQPGQSATDIANAVDRILTRRAEQAGAAYA